MAAPAARADSHADGIRKYELGLPIIRAHRRISIERMHHEIAEDWSHALNEFLTREERFEFERLGFERFETLTESEGGTSQNAIFGIENTQIGGFLLVSAELARHLVDTRLGMQMAPKATSDAPTFTRIEHNIFYEAMRILLVKLAAAYHAAGIGQLMVTRHSERLKDTLLFSPHDHLVVLRFRIGSPESRLRLTLATSNNMINAVKDPTIARHAGSSRVRSAVERLPIDLDVVLGSWATCLSELRALRSGDQLILPDGEDAWLGCRGVPLRRVAADQHGRETRITVKDRGAKSAATDWMNREAVLVSAVLACIRMPAATVAALEPGSQIVCEPEIGANPMVRLTTSGQTIAFASIASRERRLTATILGLDSEPAGRHFELWKLGKNPSK